MKIIKNKELRTFVKKITWLASSETGWGNGYVVIPKGHPYHGVHYDDIDVIAHGGLTFSEYADKLEWDEILPEDAGGWVVGFDTAHWGDNLNIWPDAESVMAEAERVKFQLQKII